MRKFLIEILTFVILLFGSFLIYSISLTSYISSNLTVEGLNSKYIIVGHSHAELTFNDSIIKETHNFASSGEAYYYTFAKLSKILPESTNTKIVLIEFTNNQINASQNDWIWEEPIVSKKYPELSTFLKLKDKLVILEGNPINFLNVNLLDIKKKISRISLGSYDLTPEFGGYKRLNMSKVDSILDAMDSIPNPTFKGEISETNLIYLDKCIELCTEYDKKVIFVRSPLHPLYRGYFNESKFQELLNTRYSKIEFLDFSQFPLEQDDFTDLEHVNALGSDKFSTWYQNLIDQGLFLVSNKSQFVQTSIERQFRLIKESEK